MAPAPASHCTEPPGSILLHGGYFPVSHHGQEQRLHGSCAGEPLLQRPRAGGQNPLRLHALTARHRPAASVGALRLLAQRARRASPVTRSSWSVKASPDQLAPPGRGRRKQPQLGLHARADAAPRGTAKEAKAAEDCVANGGMRHPQLSVGKVPGLRPAGALVRAALETFLDGRPDVTDLIEASTSEGACLVAPEPLLQSLRASAPASFCFRASEPAARFGSAPAAVSCMAATPRCTAMAWSSASTAPASANLRSRASELAARFHNAPAAYTGGPHPAPRGARREPQASAWQPARTPTGAPSSPASRRSAGAAC